MVWFIAVAGGDGGAAKVNPFAMHPYPHPGKWYPVVDAAAGGFRAAVGVHDVDAEFFRRVAVGGPQGAAANQNGIKQAQGLNAGEGVHGFEKLHRCQGGVAALGVAAQLRCQVGEMGGVEPVAQVHGHGVDSRQEGTHRYLDAGNVVGG